VVLPNGNVLSINASDGTFLFDPPNNTPIASFPTQWFEGAIIAPNGTVYLSGYPNTGLYTFNSSNNGRGSEDFYTLQCIVFPKHKKAKE
jgi:hypothetical protein